MKLNTNNSYLYVFLCLLMSSFFQCQTVQAGGKPQNSPLVTVKFSRSLVLAENSFRPVLLTVKTTYHSHQWWILGFSTGLI